jgi:molybdenum cofactor cytidylyltransferase
MRIVAALILAAGASSRLGQPKQLVQINGESLVRRAAIAAIDADCAPVVVVVGDLQNEIERELVGTPAFAVKNEYASRGVGTSIGCGVQVLIDAQPDLEGVVLLACDQPLVNGALLRALMNTQRDSGKPIVASAYANTLGIPALFARSCFDDLLALPDRSGAKPIIESRLADVAQTEFEGGAVDIDTPADLKALKLPLR